MSSRFEQKKRLRELKSQSKKNSLFNAAIKAVGSQGFQNASVSDITREAGVAQGTFYSYFDSKQDLLDQLLPELGERMIARLGDTVGPATFLEREKQVLRAFLDFMAENPEYYRIFHEAKYFNPDSYGRHLGEMIDNYVSVLRVTKQNGYLDHFCEEDFEVIACILLGARRVITERFGYEGTAINAISDQVINSYLAFLTRGFDAQQHTTDPVTVHDERIVDQYQCLNIAWDGNKATTQYCSKNGASGFQDLDVDMELNRISGDFIKQALQTRFGKAPSFQTMTVTILSRNLSHTIQAKGNFESLGARKYLFSVRLDCCEEKGQPSLLDCQIFFEK